MVFKQAGLDQKLWYDRAPKKSLLDHFFDLGTTPAAVLRGEANELGDFVQSAYESKIRRAADRIQVLGDDSSGEVEPVLVGADNRLWVTVGADHTDRKVESYGIAVAKQMCAKPIGRTAWRFEEVEPHWDRLMLRSFIALYTVPAGFEVSGLTRMRMQLQPSR